MFGNDFKRFEKNDEKESVQKPSQKINEKSVINENHTKEIRFSKREETGYNYTIKALFYFSEEEYMNRFLHQFTPLGKFEKSFVNIQPEPVSIIGPFQNYKICISLMMVKNLERLERFREVYNRGAYATMIYFDPHEEDFIAKITSLIDKNKPYSEAKNIVVVEKNDLNPELETKIKKLQDDNLIQGIYQFSQDETNNNDRFIAEIFEIIEFTKKLENSRFINY